MLPNLSTFSVVHSILQLLSLRIQNCQFGCHFNGFHQLFVKFNPCSNLNLLNYQKTESLKNCLHKKITKILSFERTKNIFFFFLFFSWEVIHMNHIWAWISSNNPKNKSTLWIPTNSWNFPSKPRTETLGRLYRDLPPHFIDNKTITMTSTVWSKQYQDGRTNSLKTLVNFYATTNQPHSPV